MVIGPRFANTFGAYYRPDSSENASLGVRVFPAMCTRRKAKLQEMGVRESGSGTPKLLLEAAWRQAAGQQDRVLPTRAVS